MALRGVSFPPKFLWIYWASCPWRNYINVFWHNRNSLDEFLPK